MAWIVFALFGFILMTSAFTVNDFSWGPAAVNKEYRRPRRFERWVVFACGLLCLYLAYELRRNGVD